MSQAGAARAGQGAPAPSQTAQHDTGTAPARGVRARPARRGASEPGAARGGGARPRRDVRLAAVDDADPAVLQAHGLALQHVARVGARVHDVQLGQHACARAGMLRP